jgi:hypothetical protein
MRTFGRKLCLEELLALIAVSQDANLNICRTSLRVMTSRGPMWSQSRRPSSETSILMPNAEKAVVCTSAASVAYPQDQATSSCELNVTSQPPNSLIHDIWSQPTTLRSTSQQNEQSAARLALREPNYGHDVELYAP